MESKRLYTLLLIISFIPAFANAQYKSSLPADKWVDSVYKSLSKDQRIAQLIIVRAHSNLGADHVAKVANDVKQYNVGALCFFQGGPVRQANLTNYYQSLAKTPLMITIDGEYGLGMRLDSVIKFPYQMTIGALSDSALVYEMGLAVGRQHKRLGVHVNYAPDVDVNNNPNNPVIGFRSFGEDKFKVATMGIAYMKGMQDAGIMACAKHFPGHGDVAVDSHLDLPVINKTMNQLDELELYPFKAMIRAGVQSIMVGHLFVPAIDPAPHRATSISKNAVNGLLRSQLGFNGLVFTDALEMKGVAKYFPGGTIAVESLIAGNDMLCLPESVPGTIKAVNDAIKKGRLRWNYIEAKVKRVLYAKYNLGLNQLDPVSTDHLTEDLNATTNDIRQKIAQKALTIVNMVTPDGFRNDFFTLPLKGKKIAYVAFTDDAQTALGKRLQNDLNADIYSINYNDATGKGGTVVKKITDGKYDAVIIGFHDVALRKGSSNFGISKNALQNWYSLNQKNAVTMVFGNPLSLTNFCTASSLVAVYENDSIFQNAAADWLESKFAATGKLPVTVCNWKFGTGLVQENTESGFMRPIDDARFAAVDSIAQEGIQKKAYPGCVVLAAKDGKIVFYKAFGNYEYNAAHPMQLSSIFDLASVTKVSATTVSVMKLYEEGKIDLKKRLEDYLPWTKKTDKAKLTLEDIILHQAGMVPFIPFYKQTLNPDGTVRNDLYRTAPSEGFTTQVARDLYIRNDYKDTIWKEILESPVTPPGKKYVYSDNDFWFLGKIVEAITKMPLEEYVQKTFYRPMHMATTGFHPLERFPLDAIVPTEEEAHFRHQLIQGTVHDEGSALGGGVACHAGLFSDAYDLGKLYQMLLNGGELNGQRFLKWETIQYFTAYHSSISRRGYGFDKPEKDNATSDDPYPSKYVFLQTYGHTGFTGTCVWVDPKYNILYIFLSNRVYPTRDNPRLSSLSIRRNILDSLYTALIPNL